MNLPNRITLIRIVLIPVFLVLYLAAPFSPLLNAWLALIVFSVAAITDAIDGYLARKLKLVTNFGKLMDPLADKILVCSAFIAFIATGQMPAWAVIVIIAREFYISGFRQLALEQNLVLAASFWAKVKTIVHMVLAIYLLLPINILRFDIIEWILIILAVVLSVWSAVEYTMKNIHIFKPVSNEAEKQDK